jgi:hypothetical protein
MLPTRSPLVRLCRNASLVRSPIGKKASPADGRTQSQKAAKSDAGAREGSKAAKVLDLLKRSGGVTLKELVKAKGWQPHSVRGFLSGGGQKDGLDRQLDQGRGRRPQLLGQGLIRCHLLQEVPQNGTRVFGMLAWRLTPRWWLGGAAFTWRSGAPPSPCWHSF